MRSTTVTYPMLILEDSSISSSHNARKIPLPPKIDRRLAVIEEGRHGRIRRVGKSLPFQGLAGMSGTMVASQNKAFRKKSSFTSLASGRRGQACEVNEGDI